MRPTCSLGVRLDPPLDAGRKKASLSHQGETVANISFVRVLRRVGSDYPFMSVLQVHVFRTWNSGHAVSFTLRKGLASNHRGFDRRGWRQSGGGGYGRRRAVRGPKVRQEQRPACLHRPPGETLYTPRTGGLLTRERDAVNVRRNADGVLPPQSITFCKNIFYLVCKSSPFYPSYVTLTERSTPQKETRNWEEHRAHVFPSDSVIRPRR